MLRSDSDGTVVLDGVSLITELNTVLISIAVSGRRLDTGAVGTGISIGLSPAIVIGTSS